MVETTGPETMKWLKFNKAWTFVPDENRNSALQYLPREEPYRVRHQCAEKALAAGVAEIVDPPQGSRKHGNARKSPETRELDETPEIPAYLRTSGKQRGSEDER